MLFFTTKGAACSVVRRSSRKVRRLFGEALRAKHAKMSSAQMSPGQDPDGFLYELDTRRERFNACDSPEGPTDRQFEDIILQALPPEYEHISTSHLEKSDFGIADICRIMSAIYAANLAHSSLTTGIAGRGAAMPAEEDNRRDIICHYYKRAGHFKKTCPLRAKHEQ